MEANKIQVIDDQGNELEYEVLFTFNNDELNKQYVLYYDSSLEEPNVYASIYDDEGKLFPIETPEEWEMVEEVFQSFMAESEEGHECCGRHKDGGCCHENDEDHECCGGHHDDDHECCKKMVIMNVVKIISYFKVWNDVKSILFIIIELFSNKNIIRNV